MWKKAKSQWFVLTNSFFSLRQKKKELCFYGSALYFSFSFPFFLYRLLPVQVSEA